MTHRIHPTMDEADHMMPLEVEREDLSDSRDLKQAVGGPEGSRLFLQYVLPDDTFDGISRHVWSGTPWIASVFTGDTRDDRRRRAMWGWCDERHGPPAWPYSDNPRPGKWREGQATVFGWTWWGFATEADMMAFEEAWPAPANADTSERPSEPREAP